jgi:hypothetical protein
MHYLVVGLLAMPGAMAVVASTPMILAPATGGEGPDNLWKW